MKNVTTGHLCRASDESDSRRRGCRFHTLDGRFVKSDTQCVIHLSPQKYAELHYSECALPFPKVCTTETGHVPFTLETLRQYTRSSHVNNNMININFTHVGFFDTSHVGFRTFHTCSACGSIIYVYPSCSLAELSRVPEVLCCVQS